MQGVIEKVAVLVLDSSGCVVERYVINMKVATASCIAVAVLEDLNRKRSCLLYIVTLNSPFTHRCGQRSCSRWIWRMWRALSGAASSSCNSQTHRWLHSQKVRLGQGAQNGQRVYQGGHDG